MSRTVFEKYTGNEEAVTVNFAESGEAITAIAAKAFLSCKTIKRLEIAGSVTEIGDWAFAHMQNLETLVLPRGEITFGKKVFLDCEKLKQVQIREDESDNPGLPYFLASAICVLKKEELCKPQEAADKEKHKVWMETYDCELMRFLSEDDEKGFDPVFFGWFRVEDIDDQLPGFLLRKRKKKTELVLERLLYHAHLHTREKAVLIQYLREHISKEYLNEKEGNNAHTAVYDYFCENNSPCQTDVRYLKILKENELLTELLTEQLLENMQKPSAEVMAYLLKTKALLSQNGSFFDNFSFDL